MQVGFILKQKQFDREDGTKINYYVLSRTLCDGTELEISVKGDKAKLLRMSLAVENKK